MGAEIYLYTLRVMQDYIITRRNSWHFGVLAAYRYVQFSKRSIQAVNSRNGAIPSTTEDNVQATLVSVYATVVIGYHF